MTRDPRWATDPKARRPELVRARSGGLRTRRSRWRSSPPTPRRRTVRASGSRRSTRSRAFVARGPRRQSAPGPGRGEVRILRPRVRRSRVFERRRRRRRRRPSAERRTTFERRRAVRDSRVRRRRRAGGGAVAPGPATRAAERAFFGPEGPGVGSRASTRVPARSKVGRSVFRPTRRTTTRARTSPRRSSPRFARGAASRAPPAGELFEAKAVRSVNSVSPDEEDRRSVFSPDDDDRTRRRNAESSVRLVPVPGASAREGFHRGARRRVRVRRGRPRRICRRNGRRRGVFHRRDAFKVRLHRLERRKDPPRAVAAAAPRRARPRRRHRGPVSPRGRLLTDARRVRVRTRPWGRPGELPRRRDRNRSTVVRLRRFGEEAYESRDHRGRYSSHHHSSSKKTSRSRGRDRGGRVGPRARLRPARGRRVRGDGGSVGPFAGLPVGAPGVALLLTSDPEAFAELDGVLEKSLAATPLFERATRRRLRPTFDRPWTTSTGSSRSRPCWRSACLRGAWRAAPSARLPTRPRAGASARCSARTRTSRRSTRASPKPPSAPSPRASGTPTSESRWTP